MSINSNADCASDPVFGPDGVIRVVDHKKAADAAAAGLIDNPSASSALAFSEKVCLSPNYFRTAAS